MTRTRSLQASTIARAGAPVLLVLAAMAVPWAAGPATLVLAGGAVVAIGRRAPVAWAWAAMVPAAALATVRAFNALVPVLEPAPSGALCRAFDDPRIPWALAEAAIVLVAFALLAVGLRTRRTSIGMRMPARAAVSSAVAGFGALAIGGLVVVSVIDRGLPGPDGPEPSLAAWIAAVLVGGIAIATAEEFAFRGVLQHWLARTTGEWPAVIVQAVAYGIWVTMVGWGPIAGIVGLVAGFVAGWITARTNSILTAWAWHAGVAVALLAAMLCP